MKTIFSFFILSISLSAFAVDFKAEIDSRLNDLLNIPSPTTAKLNPGPACLARFQNLYKDGTLNVSIGFGYWDSSPDDFVFDSFIANGLRMALAAPCKPGVSVCGFKRSGDFFTKTVRGPDGKPNQFRIAITYGSLTTSNTTNTTTQKDRQYAQCAASTNKFFSEVSAGAEVAMYIGHARDGGGPDFCPPTRTADNHVNYPWYRRVQPGFTKLLAAVKKAKAEKHQNQVIGLYSCYSRRHFANRLAAASPGTGLVMTDIEISSPQAIASLVTTLDGLIGQKCGKGFNDGIRLTGGVNMTGMFTN